MSSFRYTATELTDMILIYGECHQNAALALRTYRERYGNTRTCPTNLRTITWAVQKLRENRRLVNSYEYEGANAKEIPVNKEDNILQYSSRNPTSSLRLTARRFGVSHKTVQRILIKDNRRPFKLNRDQGLLCRDDSVRQAYCHWLLEKVNDDPDFLFNIMWTGEIMFTHNEIWNRRNQCYWSKRKTQPLRESSPEDRFSVNVWAGIHRNAIIGPIFINGPINEKKFLDLLNGTISEYIDNLSLDGSHRLWFQLDGNPAHSGFRVRERLSEMFGEQIIGRHGLHKWPAQSSDLSPLNTLFQGFLKNEVYACDVRTEQELHSRIIDAFVKLKKIAANGNKLTEAHDNVLKRCQSLV
ncbi:unnamed protein product [Parnassius mnemosyne]|uniref:DUF4817 domain-containing protein n=1 Tax=Parnassius mnemosyne TaxID=213953 RepID=A0AAV1LGX5_9NEOP